MPQIAQATQIIPEYLQPFIVRQDPSLYTPMDHASWRFILKLSQSFFAKFAHQKYLDGLRETGISIERIPKISEMDQALSRFGWRAVAVSGFIPPGVFMEFLSLGILPIACDMRSLDHLAYTPAPDIVHEAAGHAPIIADPEYSRYLKSYGEVSRKAIYSSKDMDVYNAVRALSEIKEDPKSKPQEVHSAEKSLDEALAAVDYVSEATELSRMGWWTFEYGLIGSLKEPKVYGAGLLSSLGESYHCLDEHVKKIPFSLECIEMDYDITRPQPQLFVARSFEDLIRGLDKLADRMAFRIGSEEGLARAKRAQTVTTTVLDSGVQVSGVLAEYRMENGNPYYLQFKGPTQLALGDAEFPGQGADYHKEGFGSPVGLLADGRTPDVLTESDLKAGKLKFKSGVEIQGVFKSLVRQENGKQGRTVVASFTECTVKLGEEILFRPEWGVFDMVCGEKVVSVFGGAADRKSYLAATGGFHQEPGKPKSNATAENRELNELYARVRAIREGALRDLGDPASAGADLEAAHRKLEASYPKDWLLRWEILELFQLFSENFEENHGDKLEIQSTIEPKIRARLAEISRLSPDREEMISRGLVFLDRA